MNAHWWHVTVVFSRLGGPKSFPPLSFLSDCEAFPHSETGIRPSVFPWLSQPRRVLRPPQWSCLVSCYLKTFTALLRGLVVICLGAVLQKGLLDDSWARQHIPVTSWLAKRTIAIVTDGRLGAFSETHPGGWPSSIGFWRQLVGNRVEAVFFPSWAAERA